MERTQAAPSGERDQREALEQVQMELRAARAALQTAREDGARAEEALRSAIVDATLRRDEAVARVESLRVQNRSGAQLVETLEKRLAQKEKEDAVLARGAELRDKYVDWNPNERREYSGNGVTVGEVKVFAVCLGVILLVFLMVMLAAKQ